MTINKNKAVFDSIYNDADPRGYFSVLGSLDYMIPDVAEPIIRQVLATRAALRGTNTVLDVGCSYGINAATHRFPVNFASLRQRYARREMLSIAAEKLIELDRNFYRSWPDIGVAEFIGLDISEPAIRYANQAGLHVNGVAADLETRELSAKEAAILSSANVVLSTGAIGYVTDRTYRKLLNVVTEGAWIVSFVLRMFPYDGFIEAFAERGLVTEKLTSTTFVQRRFRDSEEFERSLAVLSARGIDTEGFEADGLFQAELFLSRPEKDVRAAPLDKMITISSGRHRPFGARYVHVGPKEDRRVVIEA
ncbi:class I SAM-dependent methyltransferase [Bradyrhizobium sp. LHD-71]|uniref:class I SAM-dependent methyltransferase n=1 Tax=Bradyrhizobium sp. LHD-71 TaxID=3072141 RepID=UPI0028101DB6|nr:class I SAM-dependent methyltransferase [Bradyrhizobium sp. LHD-71]MDQ8727227.1 class I SAM-dependent methyltransferase [Bradyrhizobium sp. LHD-71]